MLKLFILQTLILVQVLLCLDKVITRLHTITEDLRNQ
jgi:hypothetical protein